MNVDMQSINCTSSSLKVDAKVQPCRKEKFMSQVWCMLVKYIQSPTLQECSCTRPDLFNCGACTTASIWSTGTQ